MVDQLAGKTIRTDGYTTIKKGLFALRNLLAKQLGQLALSDHPIVATWTFRKESQRKTGTIEPTMLTKAAEPPAVYDISQGNQTAKASKSKRKKQGDV
jgi:hypothetical protein